MTRFETGGNSPEVCDAVNFTPQNFSFNCRFYIITGPKTLRPNSEYHAAVSVQGTSQPTRVLVEVGGRQESGGTFQINQLTVVPPYSTQIVKLEVKEFPGFGIFRAHYGGHADGRLWTHSEPVRGEDETFFFKPTHDHN